MDRRGRKLDGAVVTVDSRTPMPPASAPDPAPVAGRQTGYCLTRNRYEYE